MVGGVVVVEWVVGGEWCGRVMVVSGVLVVEVCVVGMVVVCDVVGMVVRRVCGGGWFGGGVEWLG